MSNQPLKINCINFLLDRLGAIKAFRSFIRYAFMRVGGFQYDSYSLVDQVAIAISLINNNSLSSVVIDAGAKDGDFSRTLLASRLQIERLILIEPQRIHLYSLAQITSSYAEVNVEQIALSDKSGNTEIYYEEEGSKLVSLCKRTYNTSPTGQMSQTVEVTTIDNLVN